MQHGVCKVNREDRAQGTADAARTAHAIACSARLSVRGTGDSTTGKNMTSDEILVDRMRRILSRREGCSERRMLGTVCFMMHGNMRAGTWKGFLIGRFDKKDHDAMLAKP